MNKCLLYQREMSDQNIHKLFVNFLLCIIKKLNLLVPLALINGGTRRLPEVPQMQPLRRTTTPM